MEGEEELEEVRWRVYDTSRRERLREREREGGERC